MENFNSYKKIIAAAVILVLIVLIVTITARRRSDIRNMEHSSGHGTTAAEESTLTESGAGDGVSPAADSGTALNQYLTDQDNIMTNMMAVMDTTPSGNASIDFLQGMIPHHEAAVDMAEIYLKYGGTDQELKQLAEEIIDAQTGEINQMHQLIGTITSSGRKDEEKETQYLEQYQKTMSAHHGMDHGSGSNQNVEQAFAEGMIMHHRMAVEMSEAILDYTDEEEVRQLAESIIATQTQEISQMETILERVKG